MPSQKKLITTLETPEKNEAQLAPREKKFFRNEYQPFNDEKVVIKYRRGERGQGPGCRSIACGGCLGLLLLIIAVGYVLFSKPAPIWNTVVTFLNDNLNIRNSVLEEPTDKIKDNLNSQVKTVGENDLIITEAQLTSLSRDKFTNLKNLVVNIDTSSINIYWDLDSTLPENPLKGLIQLKLDENNKLYLSQIGTKRVAIPSFLNDFITNAFYSILNVNSQDKNDKYGFLSNIVSGDSVKIKQIILKEGEVDVKTDIKLDLFNK